MSLSRPHVHTHAYVRVHKTFSLTSSLSLASGTHSRSHTVSYIKPQCTSVCGSHPLRPVLAAQVTGGSVDEQTMPALRNLARMAVDHLLRR